MRTCDATADSFYPNMDNDKYRFHVLVNTSWWNTLQIFFKSTQKLALNDEQIMKTFALNLQ